MNKQMIYPKDWMSVHPYAVVRPSDDYFVRLANRLYAACNLADLPQGVRKKLCVYLSAYLEDIVSGLGLWRSFTAEHQRLYGRRLPFFTPSDDDYMPDEVNREDVCFIVWNTWAKAMYEHGYINPADPRIAEQAEAFLPILEEAYEEAPENELLDGYFNGYSDEADADRKLKWLFGHTYLTEPSVQPYIERVAPSDRFVIPTGPLALFLHEWLGLLTGSGCWKKVKGLYPPVQAIPAAMREKNRKMYADFTTFTGGVPVVYLNGYAELRRFLTSVLKWKDDDNHTLPHLKGNRNFILMSNPEKGILLAKDICEYIADSSNPMYDKAEAGRNAFRLLTEETLCPPDLLHYCLENGLLPDAAIPGQGEAELVRQNADFIARHALLYYYRGD